MSAKLAVRSRGFRPTPASRVRPEGEETSPFGRSAQQTAICERPGSPWHDLAYARRIRLWLSRNDGQMSEGVL